MSEFRKGILEVIMVLIKYKLPSQHPPKNGERVMGRSQSSSNRQITEEVPVVRV